MVRIADYLMNKLSSEGIRHAFLVTGRGALFLTDAIAGHKNIKGISVHHEQTAAFSAVAYSQFTERPSVCIVSTGCAMTNTLTGVLNAWQDGIPTIFISGQNKLKETSRFNGTKIRTYGQQEADIIPIVESITKYAVMITDPNRTVYEFEKALYMAEEGRKGPVWVDIPLDVQNMRINPDEQEHFKSEKISNYELSQKDKIYVIEAIKNAKRPVLLIGSGIRSAGAINQLCKFVEKCKIPVTYSGSAPDSYGTSNLLSIGSVGIMGCSRSANFSVQNSDLLIVIGNRLTSMTTGTEYEKFAREAKKIIVDIDEIEHTKGNVKIDRFIKADAKLFLSSLLDENIKPTEKSWIDKNLHWKNIFPKCEDGFKETKEIDLYLLSDILSEVMPENVVFHSDSGLNELILPTNINFKKNQRCIHPASQGSMGFALPAIIGSHFASNRPLVAVIGDGSIMMNLQELETIKYHNIPAKIFVINNYAYAVIRKRQIELFRNRTIGTDPKDGVGIPSFEKVANAFDLTYMKIDDSKNLKNDLDNVMSQTGPVLCEVIGLSNQDYISVAHTRNKEKRFVQRPLEDQAPFLDRDLFLSEMVIKPIDQ